MPTEAVGDVIDPTPGLMEWYHPNKGLRGVRDNEVRRPRVCV